MNRLARNLTCTLSCIVVVFLVSACAGDSPQPPASPVTRIPDTGEWFCQMNAAGDGWECVQDPLLARTPRPERLPQPSAPPDQRPDQDPTDESVSEPPLPEQPLPPAGPMPPTDPPQEPPQPPASEAPRAAAAEQSDDAPRPEYAPLAVETADPTVLAQLPGDHYAVQLIAMPSAAALRKVVEEHRLEGTTTAVVERDGQLFHVLLLGIYADAATARQAVAGLPPELQEAEPWIRRVGSLQSASLRANAVADSDGL